MSLWKSVPSTDDVALFLAELSLGCGLVERRELQSTAGEETREPEKLSWVSVGIV